MSTVRDFPYEMRALNRAAEIDPHLVIELADLRDSIDHIQAVIRKLSGDTQRRYGNTAAGRSYLAQASASLMDASDSIMNAREELR